jgi:hypothetical protein
VRLGFSRSTINRTSERLVTWQIDHGTVSNVL